MIPSEAQTTDKNPELDKIVTILDKKWKRDATITLLKSHLEGRDITVADYMPRTLTKRIYHPNTELGKEMEEMVYMDENNRVLIHAFKEHKIDDYVIELQERYSGGDCEVKVYKFDRTDMWIEQLFLKGDSKARCAALLRELRDCDDIEDQIDRHTIPNYESERKKIIAQKQSLVQQVSYWDIEKALNRGLVKPGEPVLINYEPDYGEDYNPDAHLDKNIVLLFRMPEERFCIREIVSGKTSGDYLDLHDLWIERPEFNGYIIRGTADNLSRFCKEKGEKFYFDRDALDLGHFLVALGHDAIKKATMDYGRGCADEAGHNPVLYNIGIAFGRMGGKNGIR